MKTLVRAGYPFSTSSTAVCLVISIIYYSQKHRKINCLNYQRSSGDDLPYSVIPQLDWGIQELGSSDPFDI